MAAIKRHLRKFDLKQIAGHLELIGVDEAGRGALAGPVVAAAVRVTEVFLESRWVIENARRINDSKQLTAAEREQLCEEFEELVAAGHFRAVIGSASVEEIEAENILGATKIAMRRALEGLYPPGAFTPAAREPDLFSTAEEVAAFRPPARARILIDGLPLKHFPYPHSAIVQGDTRSLCIAMASIFAKVHRDRAMNLLDTLHPGYGFAQHKGYGTEDHRMAVLKYGRCTQHRDTFLRKLMVSRIDPAQLDLLRD